LFAITRNASAQLVPLSWGTHPGDVGNQGIGGYLSEPECGDSLYGHAPNLGVNLEVSLQLADVTDVLHTLLESADDAGEGDKFHPERCNSLTTTMCSAGGGSRSRRQRTPPRSRPAPQGSGMAMACAREVRTSPWREAPTPRQLDRLVLKINAADVLLGERCGSSQTHGEHHLPPDRGRISVLGLEIDFGLGIRV
jgi:hypothetical protein